MKYNKEYNDNDLITVLAPLQFTFYSSTPILVSTCFPAYIILY